jgi:hypothetical protein
VVDLHPLNDFAVANGATGDVVDYT